ncbi:MAG: co-chaperone GroES [Gammaproteobacteria bacterium]|jgi:chaperonin GroES|uniref:Co-chaperonin GroES n=1 Tax=SAR86 cluster bacterium SAR86B TaxID=1123867 RepID=J4KTA5_9GAMM|nr:MAG: chaperonin GroS [SAR86 cluster bacterium SAR86B]|tara:strand:+ start:125 stop:412 length:288 start_codon:yes stop_codon:yes gene_type:complete
MKLKPLHDNILVKRTEEEETSAGGIILSGSAKEKPSQGTVVAVGPGKKNDSGETTPLNVAEGDTVVFGQYGGNEIKLDGEEYLILSESDIFGVIE